MTEDAVVERVKKLVAEQVVHCARMMGVDDEGYKGIALSDMIQVHTVHGTIFIKVMGVG